MKFKQIIENGSQNSMKLKEAVESYTAYLWEKG